MTEIVLTNAQAEVVQQAFGTVLVRDANGQLLGRLQPELTAEMIAELKRKAASPGPWFTGAQVQARLKSLEAEWNRTGGFDEKRLNELLAQMDAEDPGHLRKQPDELCR